MSRTITMSQGVWQEARQNSDFASFKPWMEKVVKLKQQQAEAVGYAKAAYDAMLDDFEPGASTEKIAQVFASLREELVSLITRIKESGRSPDASIITRDYPVDRQEKFGTEAASAIGFDFKSGRLDVTCNSYVGSSFDDEVRWLKKWIERRIAWIDGQVGAPSK